MPKAKFKKKGAPSSIPSPHHYTYPGSVTLKNKYGIKDLNTLLVKCSHDSAKAMINLRLETPPEHFDSSYLKYLHLSLFENTFEWAGHTRDELFIFADGTTAFMPEMKRTGWKLPFAIGDEIQEGLQTLDQTLLEKNNLKGLTREEFAREAAEIFVFLNHIHPFIDGNGRTQRLFFEKLGQAAGHQLDFSLVPRKRMSIASIAAAKDGNLEPMYHLFEDISHPEKVVILKEFMDNIKNTTPHDINKYFFVAADEGATYTGIYKGNGLKSFMIDMKGTYIIGNKEHLTPEQIKTLKPGDKITFTAPKAVELEKNLIPEEKLAPLTENEMSEMIAEDACVHICRKQIQKCAKIVYGSSKALNQQMVEMIKDPNCGYHLAQKIANAPHSFANLAGVDLMCFKNQTRVNAEEHVNLLSATVANFAHAVKNAKQEITQEHQTEQKRRGQKVAMPSQDLQSLFVLAKELQQEKLAASPLLQKELGSLVKNVNARLSSSEQRAIKNSDHERLAKSLGVSEHKAEEIAQITKKAKEVHKQLQICSVSRPKMLAMASSTL